MVFLKNRLVEQGKAPSTINLKISLLKDWLSNDGHSDHTWITIKSIMGVRGSRVERGRALKPMEMAKIVFRCEDGESVKGIRDAAILALGAGCGFRLADIVNVRLDGVDRDNWSVRVIGKGNKERLVLCSDIFCAIYKGGHLDTLRPLIESAVYFMLKKRVEESGGGAFTPHDLRRSFATRLFENGNDANIVRENMGYTSILTTQRYDKRDRDRAREATRGVRLF